MTTATAGRVVPRGARSERGPRGRIWLYAIAFVLLLVAGYLQAKGNLRSQQGLVQTSIVLSIVATAVAVASVLVPGRRVRQARGPVPRGTTTGNGAGAATPEATSAPDPPPAGDEPEVEASPDPGREPGTGTEPRTGPPP